MNLVRAFIFPLVTILFMPPAQGRCGDATDSFDPRLSVFICRDGQWSPLEDLRSYGHDGATMPASSGGSQLLTREPYVGFRITAPVQDAIDLDPRAVWVRLRNRDLYRAERVRIKSERLHLDHSMIGERSWSMSDVASVSLGKPGWIGYTDEGATFPPRSSEEWDRVLMADGQRIEGMVSLLNDEVVEIDSKSGPLRLPVARVAQITLVERNSAAGLALHRRTQPGPVQVDFADGSRVSFDALEYRPPAGTFRAQLDSEETIEIDATRIRAVWYASPDWTWLGDVEPAGVEGRSVSGGTWPVVSDRNVMGDPMIVGGHVFTRGLGMHGGSRATWRLSKPYARFRGAVVLDDSARPYGRVNVEIRVDGETRFAVEHLTAGMKPQVFDVPLGESMTLELIVDAGELGQIQDRVNWLDVILIQRVTDTSSDTQPS